MQEDKEKTISVTPPLIDDVQHPPVKPRKEEPKKETANVANMPLMPRGFRALKGGEVLIAYTGKADAFRIVRREAINFNSKPPLHLGEPCEILISKEQK